LKSSGKVIKSKSLIQATPVTSAVPRVPKYRFHTHVQRNVISGDDEKLRYIPYFNDTEKSKTRNVETEMASAYKAKRYESSRHLEKITQLRDQLDPWLEDLETPYTQRDLEHYFLYEDRAISSKYRQKLLKTYTNPVTKALKEFSETFSYAFENVFDLKLRDVLLPEERLEEMATTSVRRSLDQSAEKTPLQGLETYTSLTCLVCGSIECQTHGEFIAGESNETKSGAVYLTHKQGIMIEAKHILRKFDERQPEKDSNDFDDVPKKPCSKECYLVKGRAFEQELPEPVLDRIRLSLITHHNYCDIAYIETLPCWKAYPTIKQLHDESGKPAYPKSSARAKRPEWYDNSRKVIKGDLDDHTTAHLIQEMVQPNPVGTP
jgi:hypothetical protein